jgi:RHS repeat-associated protein
MKKYYYAGSTRIAERVGSSTDAAGVYFLLSDHLGSTTVAATASGAQASKQLYSAFGASRYTSSSLPASFKYTGQRADSVSGLYDYNARYSIPATGRFIQPDSIVPQPYNPSAWDRYAYVNNNPINRVDPTGHMQTDPIDGAWWNKYTPVYITEHIPDALVQEQMLVAYMYNHPDYDPLSDQEVVEAGYDPAAMAAFLTIEQFRAEVMRSEHNNQSITDLWANYAAPAVAAGIVLGGVEDQPTGNVNWKFRDIRHERIAYERRGWSEESINDTLVHPVDTAATVDLMTNQPGTVYYRSDGHYVVRNDITGELIQVSNTFYLDWIDRVTNQPVRPR